MLWLCLLCTQRPKQLEHMGSWSSMLAPIPWKEDVTALIIFIGAAAQCLREHRIVL